MVLPSGHPSSGFPAWNLSVSLARTTVPPPATVGRFATVVGGPNDLLVWMESQLGLHAPSDASQRLAAFCAASSAAITGSTSSLAIAASFRQHPYAVATRLLEHRDSYLMALPLGAGAPAVPCIETAGLAAAQAASLPTLIREYAAVMAAASASQREAIATAEPDRLALVFAALEDGQRLPPCTITICDDPTEWPGRWRSLLCFIQSLQPTCIVHWSPLPPGPQAKAGTSLHTVQLAIDPSFASPTVPPISEDDSLRTVRCASMAVASHAVAAALENLSPMELAGAVIVCEDDTTAALIDAQLHAFGKPTMGATMAAHGSEIHALLPLLIEAVAAPADPRRIKELLSLPDSPIPSDARWSLRKALDDLPAVGSPKWEAVLQDIATKVPNGPAYVAAIQDWIPVPAADATAAGRFDTAHARKAVIRLADWAMKRAQGIRSGVETKLMEGLPTTIESAELELDDSRRSHYQSLHAVCKTLDLLIAARPASGPISRTELVQLLETASQAPPAVQLHPEGTGGPRRVRSFAEIDSFLDELPRVIWIGTNTAPAGRCHWSQHDVDGLRQLHGIDLDGPSQQLGAKRRAERSGLRHISGSLLVVSYPNQSSENRPHPFWVTIAEMLRAGMASETEAPYELALLDAARPPVTITPWSVSQTVTPIAPALQPVQQLSLPSHIQVTPRTKVSQSELLKLLACPLAWTLDYAGKIKDQPDAGLKNDSALKGSAAEQVLREVFEPTPPANATDALAKLTTVLRDRLPFIHAGLCQPTAVVERRDFESILQKAMPVLHCLVQGGVMLTFNASLGQFRDALGNPLAYNGVVPDGAIDVLGSITVDNHGMPLVIDEKFGSREKYIKLLEDARCWQLIMYSDLTGQASPSIPVDGIGYLVLTEGKLYVPAWAAGALADPKFASIVELVGTAEQATLAGQATALAAQVKAASTTIQQPGATIPAHPRAAAAGASPHPDLAFVHGPKGPIAAKAACEYCSYGTLCGKDQVK
jgi:hypothetical protein